MRNLTITKGEDIRCRRETTEDIVCNGTLYSTAQYLNYRDTLFWVYLWTYFGLVALAGLISGLTLALLSMDLIDILVLSESGNPSERQMARKILPLVKRRHLLLVTLVLANSACVEALPVIMGTFANPVVSIVISTTLVLFFGEVLPQAICSRKGLQVGASCRGLVWFFIVIFFPISWPVSKLLDIILGAEGAKFYNRGELKKFVELHGEYKNESPDSRDEFIRRWRKPGKDGLTIDEVTIITGVLEMRHKTASCCMIKIANVFMLDINEKVNEETIEKIMQTAHSRVPLYKDKRSNIIGIVLVKNLLLSDYNKREVTFDELRKEGHDSFRLVKFVSKDINLLELLNLFQTGKSHLCVVIDDHDADSNPTGEETTPDASKSPGRHGGAAPAKTKAFQGHPSRLWDDSAGGEVVGIITLEDVIEELIQEEIIDETDLYVDVEKGILVEESSLAVDPILLVQESQLTHRRKKISDRESGSCCTKRNCCGVSCWCCCGGSGGGGSGGDDDAEKILVKKEKNANAKRRDGGGGEGEEEEEEGECLHRITEEEEEMEKRERVRVKKWKMGEWRNVVGEKEEEGNDDDNNNNNQDDIVSEGEKNKDDKVAAAADADALAAAVAAASDVAAADAAPVADGTAVDPTRKD